MPEKWRKQQACQRCRDFKVRCEFESMDSPSCNRCLKAETECIVVQPGQRKAAKKRKLETGRVAIAKRSGVNHSNGEHDGSGESSKTSPCMQSPVSQQERINELATIIRNSQQELLWLQCNGKSGRQHSDNNNERSYDSNDMSYLTPITPSEYQRSACELVAPYLNRKDCVQAAIDMNLYTYQECKTYYEDFGGLSAPFCSYVIYPWKNFELIVKEEPMLTLVMITIMGTNKGQLKSQRMAFCNRVINERIVMGGDMSPEAIKVLIVSMCYFGAHAVPRHPIIVFYALGSTIALDMGGPDDVRIMKNHKNESAELVAEVTERIRIYAGLCICFTAMSLTTNREWMLRMIPNFKSACEALDSMGLPEDRPTTAMYDILTTAQEALSMLADISKVPIVSAQAYYSSALARISAQFSSLQSVLSISSCNLCPTLLSVETQLYPVKSFYDLLIINLAETMMNRILLDYSSDQEQLLLIYAQDIYSIAIKIIDSFAEFCFDDLRLPKFVYFRPIQALIAMIRLKLITESLGIVISIDIQHYFEKVRTVWDNYQNQVIDFNSGNILEKVEKWMYLQVQLNEERTKATGGNDSAKLALKSTGITASLLRNTLANYHRGYKLNSLFLHYQSSQNQVNNQAANDVGQKKSIEDNKIDSGSQSGITDTNSFTPSTEQTSVNRSSLDSDSSVVNNPMSSGINPLGYDSMNLNLNFGLENLAMEDPSVNNDIEVLLKELFADVGMHVTL